MTARILSYTPLTGSTEGCLRSGMAGVLYDDGTCLLDEEGLTLRGYYFPFGTRKYIPYARIVDVRTQSMGWLTGKGRIWGTSHPRRWLPLDATRPRKSTVIVLNIGARVRPSFTPNDPDDVLRHLRQRCPQLLIPPAA